MRQNTLPSITNHAEFAEFARWTPHAGTGACLFLLRHDQRLADSSLVALAKWSQSDIERLMLFRSQSAKTSWCFSRLLYRTVLSNALQRPANKLKLRYGPNGKPYLSGTPIRFNWSHTIGCVALATTRSCEIGCDVEPVWRSQRGIGDIMNSFYRETEREWVVAARSDALRWTRFLEVFVQKEARLKASGHGLFLPGSHVDCVLRDPPVISDSMVCFEFGATHRFLVAVATVPPCSTPLSLEIRSHRFTGDE